MLERLLKSNAEKKVLGIVLFSDGLHLREIARRAGISPSEAKAALDNFTGMGLLKKEPRGNMAFYSKDQACPFLPDLKALFVKMEGAVPMLSGALLKVRGVRFAFVYGSYASGKAGEKSDMDVLVVGDARIEDVDEACFRVQNITGKEVNYILWSVADLEKKLKEKGAFISSVLKKPKIWLAGDENEFGRIAQKR